MDDRSVSVEPPAVVERERWDLPRATHHLAIIGAVDYERLSHWVTMNPGGVSMLIDALIDRLPASCREAHISEISTRATRPQPGAEDDAARLDWLESQFADGVHVEGCYTGSFSEASLQRAATVFYGNKEARGKTIREVIDAAALASRRELGGVA